MSAFASSYLFSLGFSERLVDPMKAELGICVLLRDLLKSSKMTFTGLALALKFMDRYAQANPANLQYSVYPVFVTALVAASKYLEDNTYTNKTWSILTGFRLSELNSLEMHFLEALKFNLHVGQDEFADWMVHLAEFVIDTTLQAMLEHQQQELHLGMMPINMQHQQLQVLLQSDPVYQQLAHLQLYHFNSVDRCGRQVLQQQPVTRSPSPFLHQPTVSPRALSLPPATALLHIAPEPFTPSPVSLSRRRVNSTSPSRQQHHHHPYHLVSSPARQPVRNALLSFSEAVERGLLVPLQDPTPLFHRAASITQPPSAHSTCY